MLMTDQLRALIQARVPAVLLLWFYVYPVIVLFKKTLLKIYAFIQKSLKHIKRVPDTDDAALVAAAAAAASLQQHSVGGTQDPVNGHAKTAWAKNLEKIKVFFEKGFNEVFDVKETSEDKAVQQAIREQPSELKKVQESFMDNNQKSVYQKLYEWAAPILQFFNMITETNFSGHLFLIIVSMFTVFFTLEKIDLSRPTFLIWFAPIIVVVWFLVVVALLLSILTVTVRMVQNINLQKNFLGKMLVLMGFILLWASITILATKKTFPPLVFEILNIVFIIVFLLILVYKAVEERREIKNMRFETHPKLEWKEAFEGVIDYTFPKMHSRSLVQVFGLVDVSKQAAYIPMLDFVGVAIVATGLSFLTFWYTDKMMPPLDEAEAKENHRARVRSTLRLVAVIIVGLTFGILLYFQILDAVTSK